MPPRVSRRLVIDASVARSAGGEDAVFPLSKQCRDFLLTMHDAGHSAVLSRPVRDEWKKHESRFARRWRARMMARKKLILDDVPEETPLRAALEASAATERGRRAMLKDAHLLEAALATDRTVVSLDDTVRGLFAAASTSVHRIAAVVWANPGQEAEGCETWLRKGAPSDRDRQLRTWKT